MRAAIFAGVLCACVVLFSQSAFGGAPEVKPSAPRPAGLSLDGLFFQGEPEGRQRIKQDAPPPEEKIEPVPRYGQYRRPWQPKSYKLDDFMVPSLSLFFVWHHVPDADHFYITEDVSGILRKKDVHGDIIIDFEAQFSFILMDRWGADVSFGFLNGPDRGLHGTLTALDGRYNWTTKGGRVFPYVKAGLLFGSMGWDQDGTFNSALGFEMGVGFFMGGEDAVFTFEVLYRNLQFNFHGGGTTVTHASALKLTGVSLKFGMRVFLF